MKFRKRSWSCSCF